jgi:hypothetical protein
LFGFERIRTDGIINSLSQSLDRLILNSNK